MRKQYTVKTVYSAEEGISALRRMAASAASKGKKGAAVVPDLIQDGEEWDDVFVGGPGVVFSAVVADLHLTEGGGVAFLRVIRRLQPDAVGVLLCPAAERNEAIEAVRLGDAFRYLVKPSESADILQTLEQCGVRHQTLCEQRPHLERCLEGSLQVLKELMQSADSKTFDRSQILRDYVRSFYRSLDASLSVPEEVELAAMFRAVGTLAVPGMVLHKARTGRELNVEERKLLEAMPEVGARLVARIPGLEMVARIIQYQAKGFDGSGFPADGVEGTEIPFGARLIRVMSDILRLEATGLHRQKALAQLELDARLYDPEILRVCHSRWRSPSQRQYERVNRAVPMEDLGLLDVLAKPLLTTTKMLIAPDGTLITRVLLKKIRDFEHLGLMSESVEIIVLRPLSPDILPSLRLVLPMANGSRDSDNPMLATARSEADLELDMFEGAEEPDAEVDAEGVPPAQCKVRDETEHNVEGSRLSAPFQGGATPLPAVGVPPLRSIAVNE